MDATCKIQVSILVFRLVHNMCPGFWVHIKGDKGVYNWLKNLLRREEIKWVRYLLKWWQVS